MLNQSVSYDFLPTIDIRKVIYCQVFSVTSSEKISLRRILTIFLSLDSRNSPKIPAYAHAAKVPNMLFFILA
jgi:hypothetical protein